ncbi:hypothetical protein [Bartonella vinsonii]|nr:hypothetical protein [Bartonella vinsonii]
MKKRTKRKERKRGQEEGRRKKRMGAEEEGRKEGEKRRGKKKFIKNL